MLNVGYYTAGSFAGDPGPGYTREPGFKIPVVDGIATSFLGHIVIGPDSARSNYELPALTTRTNMVTNW
jgi:hypothetical protein